MTVTAKQTTFVKLSARSLLIVKKGAIYVWKSLVMKVNIVVVLETINAQLDVRLNHANSFAVKILVIHLLKYIIAATGTLVPESVRIKYVVELVNTIL